MAIIVRPILLGAFACLAVPALPAAPTFEEEVAPIFKAKCTKCHGFLVKQKGLSLRSLKHVMKGGESGSPIVPGSPEKSLLVQQFDLPVTDPKRMPPAAEKNDLTAAERQVISDWIRAGAR